MSRALNQKHPHIAVVIPYYRGEEYLSQCMLSIENSSVSPDVYIVHNCDRSTPDITPHEEWRIIKTTPLIGFARAVNVGLYHAIKSEAQYLVILNQDTILHESCLDELTSSVPADQLSAAIPVIHDYGTSMMSKHFEKRTWSQKQEQEGQPGYVVNDASAACLAIHRTTLAKVGYFDPKFQMYGEDDDWFIRLKSIGGQILLQPSAVCQHAHSLGKAKGRQLRQIRGMQIYAQTILSIKHQHASFFSILKSALKGLIKTGKAKLFFRILFLTLQRTVLRDGETVNLRATEQIRFDLNSNEIQ